jgi:ribosomal protein S18 acetylase RimI-like enzyme
MDDVVRAVEMRRGTPADAAAIRELTLAAYAKWVPVIGREPKPMTADYAEALRIHRFDLLHVAGQLVALIETSLDEDRLFIVNVAVTPSFQGQGLGRRLLAHAEQLAVASGCSEIGLYTNKLFAANVQLYRRLGYQVDREEQVKVGTIVHMKKKAVPLAVE